MILFIGLGNPGEEYAKTRHNCGFMAIEKIREENGFPAFSLSKDFEAMISQKGNVILAEPQTYMNDSGRTARKISAYFKIKPQDVIVIHDDADIKIGEIKEGEGRGSAGHKGVQSIIDELQTKEFRRIRIGIASEDPSYKIPVEEKKEGLQSVVLKNFSTAEEPLISQALTAATEAAKKYLA